MNFMKHIDRFNTKIYSGLNVLVLLVKSNETIVIPFCFKYKNILTIRKEYSRR